MADRQAGKQAACQQASIEASPRHDLAIPIQRHSDGSVPRRNAPMVNEHEFALASALASLITNAEQILLAVCSGRNIGESTGAGS